MIATNANKWACIRAIADASDRYGNGPMLELLDETGALNTQEITPEQAERFCRENGIAVNIEED